MDVLSKGVANNPMFEKDLDSNYEPPVEYETLTFERTSLETSSAQNVNVDIQKNSKKRKYKIILMTVTIIVLIAALTTALGIFLGSKPKVEPPMTCPLLPAEHRILFASSTEPRVGDSVEINCTQSNKLVGPSKIICLSSGEWSAEPMCIPRQCAPFKRPDNAYLESEEIRTDIARELTILCSPGFILKGNKTVTCMDNETWSTPPTCEAVDCGLPAIVTNGYVDNITSTTFNSSLQVSCNEGYRLSSNATTIVCKNNGIWDKIPDCQPISCDLPTIPENGSLSFISGLEYQAIAVVKCNEGFELEGTTKIYCTQNSAWTPSPTCIAIDCGEPPLIQNGRIEDLTMTTFNGSFSVLCDVGYTILDSPIINCDSSGRWIGVLKCSPVSCGNITSPTNGHIVSITDTVFGGNVTLKCDKGFVMTGNNVVSCLSSGSWAPLPLCSKIPDCGIPGNIINGLIKNLSGTIVNSTYSVLCNEGYELSGPEILTCNSDGNWTIKPTCEPLSCGILSPPANRSVIYINGTTTYKSLAQITCDNGYVFDTICLSSGNWSNVSNCSALLADCFEIRNSSFNTTGVHTVSLWKSKTVIQVFCDMDTDNGGWTVFQNRFNGSVDFYQAFSAYESGFGDLNGEFWLGLKYIHEMTVGSRTELRIDLTAADGTRAYEVFRNFYLTTGPDYRLYIDPGTGTAGDSNGLSYNKGYAFSTYDRDVSGSNCAVKDHGGWWYGNCAFANLNGEYSVPGTVNAGNSGERGMTYRNFQDYKSLKTSKMMFRRF